MGKNKLIGLLLVVAGIALLFVSIFLDDLGIGRTPGFGLGQIVGTILGVALTGYGIFKVIKK
jgi:hypothetical protein